MTIRVLLADDQALLRATFRILIDSSEDMDVVAEAADGRDAVELTRTHRPDIVLMDIRMPGTDGLAATAEICADPALRGTRVLILTTFETDEHVARALRIGASGFLGKDVTAEELLDGIRTVAAGDALLSAAATRSLITRFLDSPDPRASPVPPEDLAALTAREREVTALVADGKSDKEIAAELFLSPLTVRTHVQRAKTKLGARDRAQLVAHAYRSGLARPPR
ncbi:response regulator [Streptomyces violaceoruber]|uniref:DNA-binding response regulator, LuxR family n=6 Tax=Streptomyces TaxID=1883 RepID=A0A7U9DQD3_STRLI|nr:MULTISPECIES: response regulator transcription factor [Streptomyces]QSJ13659.1 two-component system response regulator [Streptomyces lividans]WOZ02765.1 response regulator transcription factor [Streptomyces violaceoruber]AIJ18042.1 two-component system response regulator [Streptomyces lividans TK24]EFD71539.1 two-component system response regulator [Streptomyces lividans TK24]EOY45098.1 DNA-binding response regulator, LuxR family [Streptomyces lividans 1326]